MVCCLTALCACRCELQMPSLRQRSVQAGALPLRKAPCRRDPDRRLRPSLRVLAEARTRHQHRRQRQHASLHPASRQCPAERPYRPHNVRSRASWRSLRAKQPALQRQQAAPRVLRQGLRCRPCRPGPRCRQPSRAWRVCSAARLLAVRQQPRCQQQQQQRVRAHAARDTRRLGLHC